MIGWPSINMTRVAVFEENFFYRSQWICASTLLVLILVSFIKTENDTETKIFTLCQNEPRFSTTWSFHKLNGVNQVLELRKILLEVDKSNWNFQFRWNIDKFKFFWSIVVFLSLLFLAACTTICECCAFWWGSKKTAAGRHVQAVQTTILIQKCRDFRVGVMKSVQIICDCQKVSQRKRFLPENHWLKKKSLNILKVWDSLVTFNVILKFLKTWKVTFQKFFRFSKNKLKSVGQILEIWWNYSQNVIVNSCSRRWGSYQVLT